MRHLIGRRSTACRRWAIVLSFSESFIISLDIDGKDCVPVMTVVKCVGCEYIAVKTLTGKQALEAYTLLTGKEIQIDENKDYRRKL